MKMKKSMTLIAMVIVGLLSGCGTGGNTPAESSASAAAASGVSADMKHTLAASIPLTGNLMQYGISYKNALEMAVDIFNQSGGLNGQNVVLQINDDKGDQKEAINLANKIIEDQDVFAVVGSFGSSVSMAAAPVYQKAGMPMISPNTSHPDFPDMGDHLIPISPVADLERTAAAEELFNTFGGANMAILHQNTDLGVTGAEILKTKYEAMGGKVILVENFVPAQTKDFTPLISKIKAESPGILYLDGEYSDIANIILQIENIGLPDVQLAGPGNVFKQEFLDLVGDRADGIVLIGTTPVYLDSVMGAENDYSDYLMTFAKQYAERYPDVPCDGFAASAYDAAMLAMTAAKKVGTGDSAALVNEMLTVPIEIASGKSMAYENHNHVVKSVFMYTIQDGQFKSYTQKK